MSYRDDKQFVVVRGNLSDGFQFVGPFNSFDDADNWTGKNPSQHPDWIATVEAPDSTQAEQRPHVGEVWAKAGAFDVSMLINADGSVTVGIYNEGQPDRLLASCNSSDG